MEAHKFSRELEKWSKSKGKKTIGSIEKVFVEKSFAIAILFLMAIPALPIPTGGVTHLFELVVVLLSIEMIIGRKTIWLPEKLKNKELGKTINQKAIPFMVKKIRWFEKHSSHRLNGILINRDFNRIAGIVFLIFSLAAAFAPPFSGLDTLPSLGAVIVALSLILGDAVIFIFGTLIGIIGITLVTIFGEITITILKHIF